MITLPSSVSTALASPNFNFCMLVNLPGVGYNFTDNHKKTQYNAVNYVTDTQILLKTSQVNRTEQMGANSYTVTLSGVDRSIYNEYNTNQHNGKSATVYLAFLDDNNELLASDSVLEIFTGVIDSWNMSETKNSSDFSVKMTNHWQSFEINNGRFTNSNSQKEYYAGDSIFEFSHMDDVPFKWGL